MNFLRNRIFIALFFLSVAHANIKDLAFNQIDTNLIKAKKTTNYPSGDAIASAHPLATNAGFEILKMGGNAFDAAVAVSAVLAVVEPYHSGLGGGGFWLLYNAKTKKNFVINGREKAPLAATKDMFLDKDNNPVPELSINAGLAAAIPGEPAALVLISQKFGRLSLEKTLAPAIKIAREGFIVDPAFVKSVAMLDRFNCLKKYPSTREIFINQDKPYKVGELLKQTDLANTLEILAKEGHNGFYRGDIAQKLVDGVNSAGGIWSLDDLKSYQALITKPLSYNYKGMQIVTTGLPSSGGVSLIMMLKILEQFPFETFNTIKKVHYIAEAMRLSFWQRKEFLGDGDFVKVPLDKLLSEKNIQSLASLIKPYKVIDNKSLDIKNSKDNVDKHTTHFSILDKEGNKVSATLSINYIFGSSVVAKGTGVLLNDEMDDFSIKPKYSSNVFGVKGANNNDIEPGKRPLSSMTPVFLNLADNMAILGTPGGSRIPTMVLLATLNYYENLSAIKAVSLLRYHHQYLPDWLQHEPNAFSESEQEELKGMGYNLMQLHRYYGDMQIITWDLKNNFLTAISDPRKYGMAAVINEKETTGYGLNY